MDTLRLSSVTSNAVVFCTQEEIEKENEKNKDSLSTQIHLHDSNIGLT